MMDDELKVVILCSIITYYNGGHIVTPFSTNSSSRVPTRELQVQTGESRVKSGNGEFQLDNRQFANPNLTLTRQSPVQTRELRVQTREPEFKVETRHCPFELGISSLNSRFSSLNL